MNKLLEKSIKSALKTGHSLFSPSGSWKYMLCSGSIYMERDYEDTSSKAADLGSDKHELSEICLRKGTQADNYLGRIMPYENEVDDEFVEHVQYYVDHVRRVADGAEFVSYEMKVDLSEVKGIENEGGSADAVVLKDNVLWIIDAKFGYIRVPAKKNFQLLDYGIGVLEELRKFGMADGVEKVVLVIVQPKHDLIDDWPTTVKYLDKHAKKVRKAVDEACKAFETGKPVLTPGPKQCKWCKAFADCDAATEVVFEVVTNRTLTADAFDDLTVDDVAEEITLTTKRSQSYKTSKLEKVYMLRGFISDYLTAISNKMRLHLDRGDEMEFHELKPGKKGNRKFKSDAEAEAVLKASRIRQADMYDKKLISPTKAEKLLKKPKPKVWAKVSELITQAEGQPVIGLKSDPKPAATTTADKFDDLTKDEPLC